MKFLSEIRQDLPLNCLYNKVRVGCGGTTLALTNNKPYVIAVPYTALIDSKIAQRPKGQHWLGVKGGIKKETITDYLLNCKKRGYTPKIIVTYDSLPKVTEAINPQDFYILIDEYHILFQQYSFRFNAIQGVLGCYKQYKAFTFMTATPLSITALKTFTLKELEDIDYVEQEWNDDNEVEVMVEAIQCSSVTSKVVDIIQKHLSGAIEGNAYFFCNSLKTINRFFDIMPELDTAVNTRVIYSESNKNVYTFTRGYATEKPKRINFLTSTAFEGCDIYDENGVTYIISDANKKHTLLDISSSVQQIIGRIRDSKYKGKVVHIYSRDRYVNVDASKFEEYQQQYKKNCIDFAARVNAQLSREDIAKLSVVGEDVPYSIIRDGRMYFDENLMLLDAYQYEIRCQYICKASMEVSYLNINADFYAEKWIKSLKSLGIFETNPITFKDAVKECREASEKGALTENMTIRKYASRFDILEDAIRKLGYKKISSLDYSKKAIKDALLSNEDLNIGVKIVQRLNIPNGCWLSLSDIKKKLQAAYKALGINENPKSGDIEKYYSCEKKEKRLKKGEGTTKGYIIYLPLFKRPNSAK